MSKKLTLKNFDSILSNNKTNKVEFDIPIGNDEKITVSLKSSLPIFEQSAIITRTVESSLMSNGFEFKDVIFFHFLMEAISNVPMPKIKTGTFDENGKEIELLDIEKTYYFMIATSFLDNIFKIDKSSNKDYCKLQEMICNMLNQIDEKLEFRKQQIIHQNGLKEKLNTIVDVVENFAIIFSKKASDFMMKLDGIKQEDITMVFDGVKSAIQSGQLNTQDISKIIETNFIDKKIEEEKTAEKRAKKKITEKELEDISTNNVVYLDKDMVNDDA